jgi:hypothetical protein
MNEKNEELEFCFTAETGELYSLDKKERILVREVLRLALTTPSGKKVLEGRFGKKGFEIALRLMEQMGARMEKPL